MPISILYLLNQFSFGGTERVVANILNHSSENIQNYVCSFYQYENSFLNDLNIQSTNIFSLNKSSGNDLSVPFKIASFCKRNHIDIVHSMGWATYAEGLVAAKLIGKPSKFIFSYRGKTMEDTIQIPKRRILAQRFFSCFCDGILTNSEISKREYASDIGIKLKKISVLYNGVDINLFSPLRCKTTNNRKKFGIRETDLVIGSVARFDPVKGLKDLVKAFHMLTPDNRSGCKLFLVGDGTEKASIENMTKQLGIQDQVIFAGMRKDIPDCLSIMDIYVQPSLFENISNSVLEAMAAGLPVISTNVGGIREILVDKETGLVVELGNDKEMVDAITLLIKDPHRRKTMGTLARERVARYFSIEKMVSDYEEIYRKMV